MTKSAKRQASALSGRSSHKQRSAKSLRKAKDQIRTRAGTKQSTAIEMLRSPNGASIDALMKSTGWQQHSVRGFLAGVVRKRLKLNLGSTVVEGLRIYRIDGSAPQEPAKVQVRHGKS